VRGKIFLALSLIIAAGGIFFCTHHHWNALPAGTTIDRILVEKSQRKLSILRDGKVIKTYRVALGHNPIGAKEQEGDMKTPEGIYTIDYRNPKSDYHLALHVSYPSDEDNTRATQRGVNAGFDIMIHGLPNGHGSTDFHPATDWTAGCIAVTDEEIEEIYRVTSDGTTIEIRP
jgi:murein L,D-transpeptidase YafK